MPSAMVRLDIGGVEFTATATGNGPIDASINAIRTVIKDQITIQEFLIQAMTRGSDDLGRVHMQLSYNSTTVYGFAVNTDIIMAAIEAYIDGVNKALITV